MSYIKSFRRFNRQALGTVFSICQT